MEIEKVYTFELDSRHTPGTFCGYLTAPSEEVAKELVNSFGGKFGGPMELPIIPQSEFGVGFIRVSQAKLSEFDDFTKFLEAIKDQIPSDATIELVAQAIEDGVYCNQGILEMSVFTTITNIEYYQSLIDDAVEGETVWSINKNAKVGDLVLLYVCAPISAIVAFASISDEPFLEENINSEFFNTWFAEMNELTLLNKSISRHDLREKFPDWKYWKQPRNSIQVKAEYLSELLPLVSKQI